MSEEEIEKELRGIKDLELSCYSDRMSTVEKLLIAQSKFMLCILKEIKIINDRNYDHSNDWHGGL